MSEYRIRDIVFSSLRRHYLSTAAAVITTVLSIVLSLLPPIVLGRAVDRLTTGQELPLVLALSWFACSAAEGLVKALREAAVTAVGEKLTHALRTAMSRKLKALPASVFAAENSGSLTATFTNDADALEAIFSSGIASLAADAGTVVGMTIVIFRESPGLGLILVIVLPLLFLFTRSVQKKMLSAHAENRRAIAKAQGLLPETVSNIRTIHVYGAEDFAEKRYDSAIAASFHAIEKTNLYDAFYSPVILTSASAVIAIMMGLAGSRTGMLTFFGISTGTAVTVISYVNRIFSPLQAIGMEIQTIQAAIAGIGRIRAFLNLPEMDPPTAVASDTAIELKDVSFSYDHENNVLDHVSLRLDPGESLTITGRTGAGKSTLFSLLLGLNEPDAGTVALGGMNPRSIPEDRKRKVFACVPQQLAPVAGTVRDQITLGDETITEEACEKALTLSGLAVLIPHLDEPYQEGLLSHGQQQLLAIARAIASDPQILLLDEITAGLDSETEKSVLAALERAAEGRTILSISHRAGARLGRKTVELAAHS